MNSLKKRIVNDSATRIDLLDSVLFDLLGKGSITSQELDYYEKDFLRELRNYTREILKNYDELIKLTKPEYRNEFNSKIDDIGYLLLTNKMESFRDCAVETGCALCMIILKTMNQPIE